MADLAVADRVNSGVAILLGNGTGGFTPAPGSPHSLGQSPTGPVSLVAADFNGDGMQDLATANQVSGTVIVLLGNGAGGFSPAPGGILRVDSQPLSIAVGDFDGDGVPDLVTANNAGNSLTVLLGNGAGGFTPAVGSPIPVASPWAVAVADLNGDGNPDLAVASAGNGVTVLLGNGTGRFNQVSGPASAGGMNTVSLALGDFNGDGIHDIAAANFGANSVTVLLGGLARTNPVLSTTSPPSVVFGQPVPLALTVSDTAGSYYPPTGTATFMDGAAVLGTAAQNVSPYYYTAAALGGGNHTLSATFSGDAHTLGSTSNTVNILITGAPPPLVSTLSPTGATAGGPDFALTINGSMFVQASQVRWNSVYLTTYFVSATQLTVVVPAILIASPGMASISVVNPGAAPSSGLPFAVLALTIASLSPASATVGGMAFMLCATGTDYMSGTTLQWNSAPLQTTLNSATQVCAAVSASLIATQGAAAVMIVNPDGAMSNSVTFPVNTPPPVISKGGVVPVYSSVSVVQPGSWISIFGSGFSMADFTWKGDFPTSLGGVSVTMDKRPAYLWFVSPTQINLQAPDDTATGSVPVVVTTPNGTASLTVTLAAAGPSFSLLPGGQYAAGVIVTPNGSYDLLGPAGHFSFSTRPVKPGETLSLYGVGFGATNPPVPAGRAFAGSAPTTSPVKVTIGGLSALVVYSGITQSGVYQINVVVPNAGSGDQQLSATVGSVKTPANVLVTVH